MTPAGAFVLLAVAYSGNVSSNYYQSEHDCLEAKSVAETGQTIEQIKAADDARAKANAAFESAHPPRQPKDDWERSFVKSYADIKASGGWQGCMSSNAGNDICVTDNGLIQERPSSMTLGVVQPGAIKYAECFVSLDSPVIVPNSDGTYSWTQKP